MPELHVVAAGSLLEFALEESSFPVARVQFLNLYPLCFAEYLEAIGKRPCGNGCSGQSGGDITCSS